MACWHPHLQLRPSCSKRVFEIDGERCPNCGDSLKIMAAILEQPVIEKILTHLGLQARAPPRTPARGSQLQAACRPGPRGSTVPGISGKGPYGPRISKNSQESGSPKKDHHDGRVWAALSTRSSAEADSKDHSKRGQLPCRGGKGRENDRLDFLSSSTSVRERLALASSRWSAATLARRPSTSAIRTTGGSSTATSSRSSIRRSKAMRRAPLRSSPTRSTSKPSRPG